MLSVIMADLMTSTAQAGAGESGTRQRHVNTGAATPHGRPACGAFNAARTRACDSPACTSLHEPPASGVVSHPARPHPPTRILCTHPTQPPLAPTWEDGQPIQDAAGAARRHDHRSRQVFHFAAVVRGCLPLDHLQGSSSGAGAQGEGDAAAAAAGSACTEESGHLPGASSEIHCLPTFTCLASAHIDWQTAQSTHNTAPPPLPTSKLPR